MRRRERSKQAHAGELDPTSLIENSRKGCLFCPEYLDANTPQFSRDIVPEGRLQAGSAHLFPNLYPFGEYHAVAVLSNDHYLNIDQIPPRMIEDGIRVSRIYLDRVLRTTSRVRYYLLSWNHMPSAGASFIHQHLQILLEKDPTPKLEELLKNSERYYNKHDSSYWNDLRLIEREVGERYIGEVGDVTWLTSFAPDGNNEVIGVFRNSSAILGIADSDIRDFSFGLSLILKGYRRSGVNSFNMTLYSGPLTCDLKYFSLHAKIISRPSFKEFYTSDSGFLERLHGQAVLETSPEEVARTLRKTFRRS